MHGSGGRPEAQPGLRCGVGSLVRGVLSRGELCPVKEGAILHRGARPLSLIGRAWRCQFIAGMDLRPSPCAHAPLPIVSNGGDLGGHQDPRGAALLEISHSLATSEPQTKQKQVPV